MQLQLELGMVNFVNYSSAPGSALAQPFFKTSTPASY